jgi:TctA family transporter
MTDILSGVLLGLQVASAPTNLLFCFAGCLLGTLVGVLPGLGTTATVAMLLPATLAMPPTTGLITLAGIYYGAQYGGSTTSILMRLPGEATSIMTCLDGHEMTRRGRAGAALTIAALASFFAGTVATALIAALAPAMSQAVLSFTAPEYFMLMAVGLITSIVLAQGSVPRAFVMITFGLLLGMVGTDLNTGQQRFTFGMNSLAEGIPFVPMVVGLFGITDILLLLEGQLKGEKVPSIAPVGSLWPNREEIRRAAPATVRGTVIGLLLGLLPGGGALLSSFVAYLAEKRVSRTPERFGKGAVEGVAAPESANNSGAQTAFVPLLTLGLPPNAVLALMVGAMQVHGIIPGPRIMTQQPELFWGVISSMWIGNLMLLVINLPLIGIWVRLLKTPYHILYPCILVVSAIGVYSVNLNIFDVYVAIVFGLAGYLFSKWKFEVAPLVLAFVLGPYLEQYLRRTMLLSHGDFAVFIQRPISLILLVIALALLAMILLPGVRRLRQTAFAE